MESRIAFSTFIILTLRNPRILLLTLRKLYITQFLRRIQKEKKQMEIRTKIIEKSGYDEVFTVDGDNYNSAEYNSIKDAIQTKMYQ